jgi:hypothetical protein
MTRSKSKMKLCINNCIRMRNNEYGILTKEGAIE